jgi:hypothetical protein
MKSLPLLVLGCALAAPAAASDLSVDGGTAATVPFGGAFHMTLAGGPGRTAFLFVDGSPGPTLVFGESIPLGLTPQMLLLVGGTTDGAGVFQSPFFLAENPDHAGITLYLAGVILDPSDPNGLDVSNGASLTIGPKVGAGVAQSTLVGRPAVLDGSGAALSDGTLAAGTQIAWQLVATPMGSGATLASPDTLFPSFAPDVPGDYVARATTTKSGVSLSADTTIHAFEIALGPSVEAVDGAYTASGSTSLLGTITGPGLAGAKLNGAPLALSRTGDFGPVGASAATGAAFLPLSFELEHADGSRTRERYTLGVGSGLPLAFYAVKGLAARVNQAAYDLIEGAAEAELAGTDIQSLLLAQGPVQVAHETGPFGLVLFSATVKFTSVTYGALTVDLAPTSSGVSGVLKLWNVVANFDVTGKILGIGYSLTGNIKSNPATITATLALSAAGGALAADVQGLDVALQGFQFNLDGFLGSVAELFVIESAVKSDVEAAIADAVESAFPPALAEILSSFAVAGSLYDTLEVDVDVFAPISGVVNGTSGTTIQLDGKASLGSARPGSPAVTQYRATPTLPPVFGATTPLGAPFGAGLAAADDFLNLVLATATGAGLLDGDMTVLFEGAKGVGVLFQTDVLAALFPGSGFELFPPGTPVGLRSHGTMPPIVRTTPGGGALGRIDLADLEAVFSVDGPDGPIEVLRIAIDAGAELDLTLGARGELVAQLGATELSAHALQGMPGASLALLDLGIDFLEGILLPQLARLFEGIPLPSLEAQGLGLSPSEVGLVGGGSEFVGFYGGLVLVPTP